MRRTNRRRFDALTYVERGWPVHPLCDKRPILNDWPNVASTDAAQIREWWREHPEANVGIVTGQRSGLLVLDIDNKGDKHGDDSLRALEEQHGPHPRTRVAETPNGRHLYWRHPGGHVSNSVSALGPGIDVRADGGYVVAPRSVVNGKRYQWLNDYEPGAYPWHAARPIITEIGEGSRDSELFKLAASMRGRGVDRKAALKLLLDANQSLCKPPLDERQVEKILRSAYQRYQPNAVEASLDLVLVSKVEAEPVEALWPGRFFIKKINLLAGLPGLGKTTIALDIMARVTRGAEWPDSAGRAPKGDVLLMTTEDDIADTIRPRLEAMGANLDRVHVVQGVRENGAEKLFSLARHLDLLDRTLSDLSDRVRCVVLDPITGYFQSVDTHRTADVREVLAMIRPLAERHRVAVIGISHPNKASGTAAAYRITGSLAFTAGARSVWLVGPHETQPGQMVLAQLKNNLAPDPGALAYRVVGLRHPTLKEPVAGIEWLGFTEVSVDSLLDGGSRKRGMEARTDEVVDWLRDQLKDGPVSSAEIAKRARTAGHSERVLKRARKDLGVRVGNVGYGGQWMQRLPEGDT